MNATGEIAPMIESELAGLGDDEELAIGGKIARLRQGPVVEHGK